MHFEIPQYRLVLGEVLSVGNDTITLFNKYNLPNDGLATKLNNLKSAIIPLTDAFSNEKSSQLSKTIALADQRRDKAINGIKAIAISYFVNHLMRPQKAKPICCCVPSPNMATILPT